MRRDEWEILIFKKYWKIKAPQKILAFSWKVLKNRISTKRNLNIRRVLGASQDLSCVFYNGEIEDTRHLFLQCERAHKVWMKVYDWLGLEVVLLSRLTDLYIQHTGHFGSKKGRKRGVVVWHVVVWSLWVERNDIIFNHGHENLGSLLELIKCQSWSWLR